jgi:hypothetical protein
MENRKFLVECIHTPLFPSFNCRYSSIAMYVALIITGFEDQTHWAALQYNHDNPSLINYRRSTVQVEVGAMYDHFGVTL